MNYNPIVLAFLASLGGAALGAGGVYLALDRTAAPSVAPAAIEAPSPSAPAGVPPAAVGAPSSPAPAATPQGDAQRALEGVQKQEFLPLQEISEKVRARFPGDVVSAKLSEDDGVVYYELKVLTANGRILEIAADPKSGAILDVEEDDD